MIKRNFSVVNNYAWEYKGVYPINGWIKSYRFCEIVKDFEEMRRINKYDTSRYG